MGSPIQTSTGKHNATSYTLTNNFVEQWKFSSLFWNKYTFLLINSLVTNCRLQNERESEQGNKQENKDTFKLGNCHTKWAEKKVIESFSWAGRSLWSLLEGPLCHQWDLHMKGWGRCLLWCIWKVGEMGYSSCSSHINRVLNWELPVHYIYISYTIKKTIAEPGDKNAGLYKW